jgi:hypothetical protein
MLILFRGEPYEIRLSFVQVRIEAPQSGARSIVLLNGVMSMLPVGQEDTGLKPLVLMADGTIKQRATTEGTPLTFSDGYVRTVGAGETLIT